MLGIAEEAGRGRPRGVVVALIAGLGLLASPGWAVFMAGDTIPGYVHRNGAGSRVDVRADGTHDGSGWTVKFRRKLDTGDPANDIIFAAGGTYDFQVATWDNAGDFLHDTSEKDNVYAMTIPASPGSLVFSPGTPPLLSSLSGELLASDEIEITASWTDATRHDLRHQWTYDGTDWTASSDNEDRITFIWDMQGDAFASAGTCNSMCHLPDKMFTAPGTFVDTWHWKATRTNPAGFADDKYWDDGNGGTESGRRDDKGTPPYMENVAMSPPTYMAEDDPGANVRFLFDFIAGTREAALYSGGAWNAGDVLPGYVHRRGSGSVADIHTTPSHDGTGWSVTFQRVLDTGDALNDVIFAPGNTYYFQLATWDNAGDFNHNTSEMNNVYSMTLPASPGPLVFSGTPPLLDSLSGQLLGSDEIEITASWADATRHDLRKQWSFDGVAWTASADNEDRITFIWDLQHDMFVSSGKCVDMCHLPDKMFTAPGTFVDTWHWKATRTGAIGFADDKYWDDGNGGTQSGRHSDPGTSVYMDNADNGGVPTYMSAAGPGVSATFLFEHLPATGWGRAVPFTLDTTTTTIAPASTTTSTTVTPTSTTTSTTTSTLPPTPSTVTKAKLRVKFKKVDRDVLVLAGKYDGAAPPELSPGLGGSVEVGTYSKAFTIKKKGRSAKDRQLKVNIKTKKDTWMLLVKLVDLKTALTIADGSVPKPGVPLAVDWKLALDNGWYIAGPTTLTYTAKEGKAGKGRLAK